MGRDVSKWVRYDEPPEGEGVKSEYSEFLSKPIIIGVMTFVAIVILRNGWVSDDAHIIMRMLDNFANGDGFRWNVAERVQVYTCPLWTLILVPLYCITHEGFFTMIHDALHWRLR